ncbi:hypothetical protein AB1Y20_002041 [Prymnesium parvum]|uniref:Uncharacterized protein n=1 Tax=Prymnesium parvum TaxID=97485 RepID=A0AB34JAE2_PRYPA
MAVAASSVRLPPAPPAPPVPSLLQLALDAMIKHRRAPGLTHDASKDAGGTFWGRALSSSKPTAVPVLPISPVVKESLLHRLRVAGRLEDECLLLLLDSSTTALSLASCRSLSSDSLQHLPLLAPALTHLDLSWCYQLRSDDLAALHLPRLRALALRGCFRLEGAAVWEFTVRSPELRSLNLASCDRIVQLPPRGAPLAVDDKRGTRKAREGGALVSPIGQLIALLLREASISMDSLLTLPTIAPALRVLVLRGMTHLDDSAMDVLVRGCPALQHLDVQGCHRLHGTQCLDVVGGSSLACLLISSRQLGATPTAAASEGRLSRMASLAVQAASEALHHTAESAHAWLSRSFQSVVTVTPVLQSGPSPSDQPRPLVDVMGRGTGPLLQSHRRSFASLRLLRLVGAQYLDASLIRRALATCTALEELVLGISGPRFLCGRLVDTPLPRLRRLRLIRCETSASLAMNLVTCCPALLELQLCHCGEIQAETAAELGVHFILSQLVLVGRSYTDEHLAEISSLLPERIHVTLFSKANSMTVDVAAADDAIHMDDESFAQYYALEGAGTVCY